jgi:DUF177 domain-containing protein
MTLPDPGAARRHAHPVDPHGDPLTFALSGFLAEPPGSVRDDTLDGAAIDPIDGLRVTEPVTGTVHLSRTNRGIVVDARLSTAVAGECVRCLRPVITPLRLRIDEEVLPTVDLGTGQPVPVDAGDDAEVPRLTDHHELELRPLVEEAISLAEPIAPLCEPDCPGLCPDCGERLTPGHAHGEGDIDPRLEALRAFRVDGTADTE